MSKQELEQKGFTIIEVVLVLAIAALIFLMVFIALPALQRTQRDQERKTIVADIVTAIQNYQGNHNGQNPTGAQALNTYIDGTNAADNEAGEYTNADNPKITEFTSAASTDSFVHNNYFVRLGAFPAGEANSKIGVANSNVIQIYTGAKCDDTNTGAVKGTTRNAAVLVVLENGKEAFCSQV